MRTTTYKRMQMLAVTALVICAVAAVWSTSASAYTDPGRYSSGTASSPSATEPANVAPPVVTLEAPQAADDNSETLPIVLSSVAVLVAIGGAAFTVLAGGRTRRAPQPTA